MIEQIVAVAVAKYDEKPTSLAVLVERAASGANELLWFATLTLKNDPVCAGGGESSSEAALASLGRKVLAEGEASAKDLRVALDALQEVVPPAPEKATSAPKG